MSSNIRSSVSTPAAPTCDVWVRLALISSAIPDGEHVICWFLLGMVPGLRLVAQIGLGTPESYSGGAGRVAGFSAKDGG